MGKVKDKPTKEVAQTTEPTFRTTGFNLPAKIAGFAPRTARVTVKPFYTDEDLKAGIVFTVTGSGVSEAHKTAFLECTEPSGEVRQLFLSYELERLLNAERDMGKSFAVRRVGTVDTDGGKKVHKYEVLEGEIE